MDKTCYKCDNVADQNINHKQYCKDHYKYCSYDKCDNVAHQIIDGEYYCKDHRKYCSYDQCEQLATEYKYSYFARRGYFVCNDHLDQFDTGDEAIIINCRGDKCRRKISYAQHGIWCTACNSDFNPFWKYDEDSDSD